MTSAPAPTLDDLRRASRRAERLEERVARLRPRFRGVEGGEARKALVDWARAFSGGDAEALERRLSWDGIEPELAAAALAEPEEGPPDASPRWLERALSWNVVGRDLAGGPLSPRLDGVPFPELWRPWVNAALARWAVEFPELAAVPKEWRERLAVTLGRELARVSDRAAFAQFERERAARPLGSGAHRAFVARQLTLGLLPLYTEFPVLLRQTGELVDQFVAAGAELFARWRADRAALAAAFGAPAERFIEIELLESDRHAGGRRVARLAFEGGLQLVYKPRSVGAEARWAVLCDRLRAAGLEDTPPAARALERYGYGWAQWVPRSDPADDQARARWFRRAGALVALADLLGAEDLHAENLISTSDGPVAIDLELLLRPARGARDLARGGVFESGLVARRSQLAGGERAARWAGFGTETARRAPGFVRGWAGLGSDDLHPVPLAAPEPPASNLPRSDGRTIPAAEQAQALVEGYRSAYRFLLARRAELSATEGMLAPFSGIATRILFRPSQEYATLLDRLTSPAAQRDAAAAGLLLEAALRPFAGASERPLLWPLVAEERAALQALDIPRFEEVSDARGVALDGGGEVAGLFLESGVVRMKRRFALWSEADLEAQASDLERELAPALSATAVELASEDRFELAAHALVTRIAQRRLELGVESLEAAGDDLARRVRRASLYDGLAGEALLFAFAGAAWPEPRTVEAATLARASFEGAVERLAEDLDNVPLGAMQGVGSWLWSLAWLDRLARDSRAAMLASRLLGALDRKRLTGDRRLDVEGGLAGLVLGLLAAHGQWPESGAQALARNAGELLLERAEPAGGGLAWRGELGRPLAGFAHGASGIARALAALAVATGEARFATGARAALAFERSLFDPKRGNWPVVLADGPTGEPRSTWMTAWCHGAAGIGLTRLELARMLAPDPALPDATESELEVALATTAAAGAAPRDHLCCGSAGRASILVRAAGVHARPEWRRPAAAAIADAMLQRAAASTDFELPRGDDPLLAADWGMMRGRIGVAWMLAELAGLPLPSVLALESPSEHDRRLDGEE